MPRSRGCASCSIRETVDDALRILGPPDFDIPSGHGVGSPYLPDKAPVFEDFRTLRYEHLSETVNVDIADRPGRRVGVMYIGKYIGPPRGDVG